MSTIAFHTLNRAVLEFVVEHRDDDPVLATMQRAITELSRQAANIALDRSKRVLAIEISEEVLRVLLSYIYDEYPEEFRTFPPVSGFTRL